MKKILAILLIAVLVLSIGSARPGRKVAFERAGNFVADSKVEAGDSVVAPIWKAEALAADPTDSTVNTFVIWLSDGTGSGDSGDVMIKITTADTTKTFTLLDFSS